MMLLRSLSLVLLLTGAVAASAQPAPDPDLAPEDVVRIQLEALQHNDEPTPDVGIETTYRFASPNNRVFTGPLERFTEMVKGPIYRDLIGFERAEYGPVQVEGDDAAQRVTLVQADGRRVVYVFVLSRQTGPCEGCWMTDSVVRETELPTEDGSLRKI